MGSERERRTQKQSGGASRQISQLVQMISTGQSSRTLAIFPRNPMSVVFTTRPWLAFIDNTEINTLLHETSRSFNFIEVKTYIY